MSIQCWFQAARRHFQDADHLMADVTTKRLQSADHLYGLAAECAAKVIFQLANQRPGQRYSEPPKEHINILWPQFWAQFGGREAGELTGRLPSERAFSQWKVNHRYDCSWTPQLASQQFARVNGHRAAAEKLIIAAEGLSQKDSK